MKLNLRHIFSFIYTVIFCTSLSIGQHNDTTIFNQSDSDLKFWYEYIADENGGFINYVESCDTSKVGNVENRIPNCVSAHIYDTSKEGLFFVKEYYFDHTLNNYASREGWAKAFKIKRRILGIPLWSYACYYRKIGNWINLVGNEKTKVIEYNSNGPIFTAELPKNYYD